VNNSARVPNSTQPPSRPPGPPREDRPESVPTAGDRPGTSYASSRVMGHVRWLLTVAALVAVTGCAASRVGSHIERGRDFTQYRTYDWGPADRLPIGDPRLAADPHFQDYLQGAVERGLVARGYRRDESGAPDVLIHFHATTAERLIVDHEIPEPGQCFGDGCRPSVSQVEQATLVFDLIDARTSRPIWRGWAQFALDDLRDRDRVGKRLSGAVERMLVSLPRGGR